MKTLSGFSLILSLLLGGSNTLIAEISDPDKVYILTDYLIKEESQKIDETLEDRKKHLTAYARNRAIATVYGKPKFESLVYDDVSEMFFGRIVSTHKNFVRDVNFYMPKQRARLFKKQVDAGLIEIKHAFDGNALEFKTLELQYNGVNYPIHSRYPNTLTLKLGGYFIGTQNTDIYTKAHGIGATINLQDLFDMEEKVSVARVSASYKFNPKHSIEASWYRLNTTSNKSLSQSFTFNGKVINVGANLNIYYNTDIYKLNYIYSAYQTNRLKLSFRIGLHITKIATGFDAAYNLGPINESFEGDSIAMTAPLPILGLGLGYEIIPNLSFNYVVDYFAFSYQSNVSGTMSDSLLSLDYHYNRYLGLGGGFNSTQLHLEGKVEETKYGLNDNVAGFIGYVTLSY